MPSFTITTPSTTVTVSPSSVKPKSAARASTTYQVTNKTGTTVKTALRIVPGPGTEPGWFKVREREERDIAPGKTEDFAVDLSIPGSAANRGFAESERPKLSFHAVAVNLADSDNDTVPGGAVAFQAPALQEDGGGLPWWMIAIPIGVVLLVAGVGLALWQPWKTDAPMVELADWAMKPLTEARLAIEMQGLQVSERHPSDLAPTIGAERFYQQIVQAHRPGPGQVATGTTVELVWEWQPNTVSVPNISGSSLQEAIAALEQAGLRFITAQDPSAPQQPRQYPVVSSWAPSGSVPAGTGITLTMRWADGGLVIDPAILTQRYQELRQNTSREFILRGGVQPEQ